MVKMQDLTGLKFNRWTVVSYSHRRKKLSLWNCICECGTKAVVFRSALTSGHSKSCGCLRDELASERSATHRMSGTSFHLVWKNIHSRCNNKSNRSYKYYGARGIKVCKRWDRFENFYNDMWPIYSEGMSIERPNNNKNYQPSNCIWIPKRDQSKNRRTNVFIDTPWGKMTCADAARKLQIRPSTFCIRRKRKPKSEWFKPRIR